MANKESTAVNALIDLVQAKPLGGSAGPGEDLFSAPRPPQPERRAAPRAPAGTSQLQLHAVPAGKVRMLAAPTNGGVVPSIKQALPPPLAAGTPKPTLTRAPQPIPQPLAAMAAFKPSFTPPRPEKIDLTGDVVAADPWFESSRAVEKFEDETFVGTAPVVKLERRRKLAILKILGTSVVFVVIGVVIGAYIAFHGEDTPKSAAKVAAATPKTVVQAMPPVAPQPAAVLPPTTPKLADVRIDSKPAGATVMLVDGGKTSFLGTTPIATSLDPSRAYDVVFTLEGRPTKIEHFDPSTASHIEVALDKPAARAPAPVAAAEPPPVHHHSTAARTAPTGQIADPGFESSFSGNGTLMVSTKPPCEIIVDGKATGLHTPQRALALSAGAHKITFVNAADHINKTIAVSVTADHTTKLVKDLLN
jgi:hypothetical protein